MLILLFLMMFMSPSDSRAQPDPCFSILDLGRWQECQKAKGAPSERARKDLDTRLEEQIKSDVILDQEIEETIFKGNCIVPDEVVIAKVRDKFELLLNDAKSARFRNICQFKQKERNILNISMCGLINYKNEFGAYGGYKFFYAQVYDGGKFGILDNERDGSLIDTFSTMHCMVCSENRRSVNLCKRAVNKLKYLLRK